MKIIFSRLFLLGMLLAGIGNAQVVTNDKSRERLFLSEVKVIDEFIERFNDDPNSFLRQEYKKAKKDFPYTRLDMLNTLFNYHNNWHVNTDKDSFITQVIKSELPQKLYFNRKDWYAETKCIFNYNKQEIKVTLIMEIKADKNNSAKWMISNVVSQAHAFDNVITTLEDTSTSEKGRYFISPSSCATNFLELHQVLTSSMNAANFFTKEALANPSVQKLVALIENKSVMFNTVDNVKFYFFQIPNYVFTVENFIRSEANSGWLINNLMYITETEKEKMKVKLLK